MNKLDNSQLPVFTLSINPDEDVFVDAVALVQEPAHHSMYLSFDDDKPIEQLFQADDTKQQILGAAMIPDKLIRRNPNNLIQQEHYVKFSADMIALIAKEFFRNGFQKNINVGHTDETVDAYFYQSILIGDEIGQGTINGLDLPKGSWVLGAEIKDKNTFNKVKEFGFSVEGRFLYQVVKNQFDSEIETELQKLISNLDKYNSVLNTYKK